MANKYTQKQREKLVNHIRVILSTELKGISVKLEELNIHDDTEVRELAMLIKSTCGSIYSIAHILVKDASVTFY